MSANYMAISGVLIAGFATGLGALPIYLKRHYSKEMLDIAMGFSAGIMLVASFVSLIIPGMQEARNLYSATLAMPLFLLSLFLGYVFIIFIHDFIPHKHLNKKSDMELGGHEKKLSRVMLITMAIALHNIPEGLAVGVGFGGGNHTGGMALAIAIALQNIPEGLVVAFGILNEGATRNRAFFMALLSGLVEPIAAGFGYLATSVSSQSLPLALGFAAGTMLFVICQEMLPELFRQGHERNATLGVIIGVMTMLAIDFYL
ncbi:metal cation transporter, ZIP domain protein [Bacteriovorax sp. BAL6_X]|uniref:ZIP family metal transporter n=1 Tax=Bacteriovorax sp. BAL6_X TaxID=1201290 RepID=UPI0003864B4E|nr:ZIP family metal transporter [Bacteriovorax sp. BAL6_X]EPZ49306.1 metal cation transporter, ZIP domain protein [Bacteriovorax sp. BAL6_X]